jgi:hypothetical protein
MEVEMYKITGLLLIMTVFFACSSYEIPDYEKMADQITAKTAKKLKAKKGLALIGTSGQMMKNIQMMAMHFNFYREVDIETARNLLVESIQEYLYAINSNEEIKPYLHDNPFTDKNVEITIYFYNPDRSDVLSDSISIATSNKGKIIYYIDYPEKYTIKPILEESYQEAVDLVDRYKRNRKT